MCVIATTSHKAAQGEGGHVARGEPGEDENGMSVSTRRELEQRERREVHRELERGASLEGEIAERRRFDCFVRHRHGGSFRGSGWGLRRRQRREFPRPAEWGR